MRAVCILATALGASLLLGPTQGLSAQNGRVTAQGTVRGQDRTPVSGAMVVARNLGTGEDTTARSNPQGEFEIRNLAPGSYDVEVSRASFLSQTRRGVALAAGRVLRLDFVLQSASESSTTATVQRISESQLVGLPLNGRSYNQLATLQAGITDTAVTQASRGVGGGSLTVSGGRSSSNNFLLDGTNIMDTSNRVPRSAAGVQLGLDAVFQVQVFSTNYGAEYGRGSGGVLNSISRSGTNQLHLTLFEYFRNSKLDTRNFFDVDPLQPTVRSQPPPFKRNQFGFTVTGPIRKERTFLMGSFEAMHDRLTATDITNFPDAKAREGRITDRAGEVLFEVPVNPRVQPYLDLYPIPNGDSIGGGFGDNWAPMFLPTDENYGTLRLDHKLSERDSFFARYTLDDATSTDAQAVYLFRTLTNSRQQYATLVGNHIFSLSALTAFRFGYTRPVEFIETLSALAVPRSLYFVPDAPQFGQIDLPGIAPLGPSGSAPARNVMNSFQLADDVVMQRGPHGLKFGAEVHRYRWEVFNSTAKSGQWSFNSLESFLQGGPEGTSLTVALPGSNNRKSFRQTLAGFYLQDAYGVTSHLQLSLGLRYEVATIIQEKDNRLAFLPDPLHDQEMQIGPMLPENPSRLNFSPRLGFTWSPPIPRNTVLSGGFGIYYDPLLEYVIDMQKNSAPFYTRAVLPNFDSSGTFPDAVAAALQNSLGSRFQVEVLDYHHIQTPRVLRYNVTLQRELGGGLRVQAAYVGARGNHLFRGYEANLYPFPLTRTDGSLFFPPHAGPRNPAFGSIRMTSTDAQSFYNALQLSAAKSLSRGLSFQANYNYGKSVDDASANFSSAGTQYPFARTLDRGLSDFDLRHRFSFNYFYVLPFGNGQRYWKSGIVAGVLGGWRLGGILSFRTGTPVTPGINVRIAGFLFAANRPNLLPGRSNNPVEGVTAGCAGVPAGQPLGGPDRYFDPCSFSVPEPGTLGNAGRNTIIGPRVLSLDVSLQKELLLGGEKRLQFRAEVFNLPNHTNFASPSTSPSTVFSGSSGRPNATAGRLLRSATTSRQIQFALRFSF